MTRKWARAAALGGIRTLASIGGTNDSDAHVCEPICINMYCRAKHNNQEKTTHSLKEGVTKISELWIYPRAVFFFYFPLWCDSVHRHGHHCRSSPQGEVRIVRRTATRAHFVVINRCWTVLSELWYEVASNLNTFFLSWRLRTAAVFFKNVTNFTVIWVKRRPKAGSVDLCWARADTADISSKITPRKE